MNTIASPTWRSFFAQKLTVRHFLTWRLLRWLGPLAVVGGGIAAVGAGALPLNSPPADEVESFVLPVNVVPLKATEEVEQLRTFAGVVKAHRVSELSFDRTGRVVRVLVDEGQTVVKGDVLAELDQRNLRARRKEVVAQCEAAQARLDELVAGPRTEVIEAARADVEALQGEVGLLRERHRRNRSLLVDRSVAQGQFDETKFGLDTAEAKLRAAQQKLTELEAGTRKEQLAAQRAVVEQLASSLEDIDVELEDSVLVAPFAGTVSRRHVDEGTVTGPSTPIVRLVESGRLEAWIGLPVQAAESLAVGAAQPVTINSREHLAYVDALLPELDPTTRTQTVIFRLESSPARTAVPGQVARVTVTERRQQRGFWVPTEALYRGDRGLWTALVVERNANSGGDVVVRRHAEVLYTEGHRSLVRGMFRDGEQIVVDGAHRLAPGQAVTVNRDDH